MVISMIDDDQTMHSIPVTVDYRTSRLLDYPFHSHAEYEIYYFHEGKCNYLIGDSIYLLQPGDLIIMHGMTLHRPNIDANSPYIRSIIHFDPSYTQGLFDFPHSLPILKPFQELGNVRFHLNEQQREEVESLYRQLYHYKQHGDQTSYNRFVISLMDMLIFVYELSKQTMREQPSFPSEKVRHVQNIITYIEQYFSHDLQLDQLAAHLHFNKYYLAKIFKEVTGVTIINYLQQRRINEAKIIFLTQPHKSVTEVSYEVGFKHPAHFSRVFKQQVNCTAEQYRRTIQDTNQS